MYCRGSTITSDKSGPNSRLKCWLLSNNSNKMYKKNLSLLNRNPTRSRMRLCSPTHLPSGALVPPLRAEIYPSKLQKVTRRSDTYEGEFARAATCLAPCLGGGGNAWRRRLCGEFAVHGVSRFGKDPLSKNMVENRRTTQTTFCCEDCPRASHLPVCRTSLAFTCCV